MSPACSNFLLLLLASAAILASAQPASSCGNEGGTTPRPCSVPAWPATYQMNASTIIMACNYTGYQAPETVAGWGVVDFDWSNDLAGWSAATPMDNDERQLEQVKAIKRSPHTAGYTKVWMYRNTVYGYPWFTSVRKLLDDPVYKPWFILFNNKTGRNFTSPPCDHDYQPPKCTDYFHTQMDTPRSTTKWGPEGRPEGGYGKCYPKDAHSGCDCGTKPCGFYVFNHSSDVVIRNQTFREWFLDTYMFNENGGSPLVDGFYWDDTWNPGGVGDDPEPGMIEDMGLSKDDLLQLTASYDDTMAALRKRTISEGKFAWQLMTQERVRADDPTTCAADLGRYCSRGTGTQTEAMYYAIGSSGRPPTPEPAPAFRNCSVFGCTCKGAADYYGIGFQGGSFGCAPKGAQDWWIHRAEQCTDPATSCCTAADSTQKDPPYAGCDANGQPVEGLSLDLANFLLIRGPYAWLGHGWGGCAQPTAAEGGGYPFPKLLHSDFGVPVDTLCEETVTPGVFERKFTKATVQMDCNTGVPSIVMNRPFNV